MSKSSVGKILIAAVLLGGLTFGVFHWLDTRNEVETDDAAIESHIIPLAAKISGYVVKLSITDNQHVKAGDVLMKIDPRDYQFALDRANANLAAAEARLIAGQHNYASTAVSAPSNLASAKSQVEAAAAEAKNTQQALRRLQNLSDAARSRQSLEDAIAADKQARSNLEDAKARLRSAETAPDAIAASEASVQELQAAVALARAEVATAQKNLDDTVIRAPVAGRVTRRSVEAGAYIQPGQQLAALVSDEMWVTANFKETQLEHIRPGQMVDISVDAYPGHDFHGRVDSIQSGTGARFSLFPPENATGNFVKIVQRVPVKILFTEAPEKQYQLGPGMSVVPIVHVE